MAETPDKPPAEAGKKKKSKKAIDSMEGHNLDAIQKKAEPLWKALEKKLKAKQEAAGNFTTEINELYAKAEKDMGVPESILRDEFKFFRNSKKRAEKEAEFSQVERDAHVAVRDAFKGTPFESYMNVKIAKGAVEA